MNSYVAVKGNIKLYRDRHVWSGRYRAASIDYRLGYWERELPAGTFRPPITALCRTSRL